jgi:rod shape-determining protein MreD
MIARAVRLGLLLVALVTLQTTLVPHLRIFGVVPDLGLVAAVALALRYGPELGATFGFAAGLATDAFLQTPLGLSALAIGLTAYLVGVVKNAFAHPAWWTIPAVAALAGVVAGCCFVGFGAMVGQSQLWELESLRTILLAAAYDGIVAPAVFPVAVAAARVGPRHLAVAGGPGYR